MLDPAAFPLAHLSVSSLNQYLRCPEKWRRRYLEREHEPQTAPMLVGAAAGAAEAEHYHRRIDGGGLAGDEVLDAYSDEYDERAERARDRAGIDWQDERPAAWKDAGARAVEVYHERVAPRVVPVTVERKFALTIRGMGWQLIGYADLETAQRDPLEPGERPPPPGEPGTAVDDLKFAGKRWTRSGPNGSRVAGDDVLRDLQPTLYLAARRAEGNPAPVFRYHVTTRTAEPVAEVIETTRTARQLDEFLQLALRVAGEIAWRIENDVWHGAPPGSWYCSSRACGFWRECKFGGRDAVAATATVRAAA